LTSVVIGSDPEVADVVFDIPTVSAGHCQVWRGPGTDGRPALFVADMDSTNGTWVDGQRLIPNQPYRVYLGAYLSLGQKFGFELTAEHLYPQQQAAGAAPVAKASGTDPDEAHDAPLQPGQFVADRYLVFGWLGEGGMAIVYRGKDTHSGDQVALKVMRAECWDHPTAKTRVEREARILASLDHPYIVDLVDTFSIDGLLTLVLEYLPGGDLTARLQEGPLPPPAAAALVERVLAGLQALHDAGLVHRDIKPQNILLDDRGQPRIADLGVAHDQSARGFTRHGARIGTPEFMAPEQHQGVQVDARTDVYSAGLVLYCALVGHLPWSEKSDLDWAIAHTQKPIDTGPLRRVASAELVSVVVRALEKRPQDRWPTARAMARALAATRTKQRASRPEDGPTGQSSSQRPAEATSALRSRAAQEAARPPTPSEPEAEATEQEAVDGWEAGIRMLVMMAVIGAGIGLLLAAVL